MFHGTLGKDGGVEDTIAWAYWPPLQIYVFEIIRNSVQPRKSSNIFESNC